MGPMLGFVGLVFFIVVIGLVAAAARGGQRKVLGELAAANGLAYQSPGPGLHVLGGALDGRPFEMRVMPDGPQRMLTERWRIVLATPPPASFGASKNKLLRGASPGRERVSTGDASFDRAVFAEAEPGSAAAVIAWLSPERRAAIAELAKIDGLVFEGAVLFHKNGLDTSRPRLDARLALLRSVADRLDRL